VGLFLEPLIYCAKLKLGHRQASRTMYDCKLVWRNNVKPFNKVRKVHYPKKSGERCEKNTFNRYIQFSFFLYRDTIKNETKNMYVRRKKWKFLLFPVKILTDHIKKNWEIFIFNVRIIYSSQNPLWNMVIGYKP